MKRTAILLATALATAAPPLAAQDTAAPTPGTRVRVHVHPTRGRSHSASTHVGPLVRSTADTVVLSSGSTGEMSVPRSAIYRMDVSGGGRSRLRSGLTWAGLGALGGLLVGAGIGAATYEPEPCGGFCLDFGREGAAATGGVIGAVGGLAIGGVLGAMNAGERWVRVPLQSGLRITPTRGGLRVAVSF